MLRGLYVLVSVSQVDKDFPFHSDASGNGKANLGSPGSVQFPDDRQWRSKHKYICYYIWEASTSYVSLEVVAAMATWNGFLPCVSKWEALLYA